MEFAHFRTQSSQDIIPIIYLWETRRKSDSSGSEISSRSAEANPEGSTGGAASAGAATPGMSKRSACCQERSLPACPAKSAGGWNNWRNKKNLFLCPQWLTRLSSINDLIY